jgi:hypothetical protein
MQEPLQGTGGSGNWLPVTGSLLPGNTNQVVVISRVQEFMPGLLFRYVLRRAVIVLRYTFEPR